MWLWVLADGPGRPVGVGSGWTSAHAWLMAGAVMTALVLTVWLIARPSRGRGRGAELALRRYDLRRHARRGRADADGGGPPRSRGRVARSGEPHS